MTRSKDKENKQNVSNESNFTKRRNGTSEMKNIAGEMTSAIDELISYIRHNVKNI